MAAGELAVVVSRWWARVEQLATIAMKTTFPPHRWAIALEASANCGEPLAVVSPVIDETKRYKRWL
jgi:hypothetical protein